MVSFIKNNLNHLKEFLKRFSQFFLLSIIAFFRPSSIYRLIASRPLKRSYIRLAQGFLGLSLIMAVIIHPFSPILIVGLFIAMTPLVMMSIAIDPFVSWLRGEDETPWLTFSRYLSQGLWAILITVNTFMILLIVILLIKPEFMSIFEGNDIQNADSIKDVAMFLVFSFFLTIHFAYSQMRATTRKSHRFSSVVIFSGVYLVIPLTSVLAKNLI